MRNQDSSQYPTSATKHNQTSRSCQHTIGEIKTTILQASGKYRAQIAKDTFSISEDLWNIIQRDMECQSHYIQLLLADELNICKEKENSQADNHIKKKQDVYKIE